MGCRFRFHKFVVKNIEGLFTKLDLSEKFINRKPISINSVWALLPEDLCKNCEDNIKMMPKLRTYIKSKNDFEVEPYIMSFMSRQSRSYLAQLKNGDGQINAVEEELCLICNNDTV